MCDDSLDFIRGTSAQGRPSGSQMFSSLNFKDGIFCKHCISEMHACPERSGHFTRVYTFRQSPLYYCHRTGLLSQSYCRHVLAYCRHRTVVLSPSYCHRCNVANVLAYCRHRTVVMSPSYCRTVTIVLWY